MDSREALVKFMEEKVRVLERNSGRSMQWLFTPEDREDLLGWSEADAKATIKKMLVDFIFDASLCPWCVRLDMRCSECSYRERHGRCGEEGSDYRRFRGPHALVEYLSYVDVEKLRDILRGGLK